LYIHYKKTVRWKYVDDYFRYSRQHW
jgi:hypothetical protein